VDCGYGKICTIPAKVQGICPDGWHLPTRTEWNALFTEVGGKSTAGKILKSQTGWDGNGTDEYGFSALPAGGRYKAASTAMASMPTFGVLRTRTTVSTHSL